MRYINNAFSLSMLPLAVQPESLVEVRKIDLEEAKVFAKDAKSCVGHADTASVFTGLLGMPVEFNRVTTALIPGDKMLVGQYMGPRLPEGVTTLPEGSVINWLLVSIW